MRRLRNFLGFTGEEGAIAPFVALGLVALTGLLALSLDLGQLFVVKNELQNVADAAALAAAKQLVQADSSYNAVVNCTGATTAAKNVASQNKSLGDSDPLVVNDSDVIVGQWNFTTKQFSSVGCDIDPLKANAVQVTVRRELAPGDTSQPGNSQVSTFFGGMLGISKNVSSAATAIAYLGITGKSSIDIPFMVSKNYPAGGTPLAQNGFQRILEMFGPQEACAVTNPQSYRFKDLGGNPPPTLDTTRASFVVPTSGQVSLGDLQRYITGSSNGGSRFPQISVGQRVYPASEYNWGGNVKSLFTLLKTRWNNSKNASGKWRVTVMVYSTSQVTAAQPRDSWFKLASQLLPGVSQAYACQSYSSPAVYNQGFIDVDITNVNVNTKCNTNSNQVSDSNSCRNTCYMDVSVPLTTSTVSTDKGSDPGPTYKPRSYDVINTGGNSVGVFAAVPRLVK